MPTEPTWLDRPIIETLHTDQILEHGGSLGIRDEGLLESALARPQQKWHYEPGTDLATLAAAYAFGVAKNHPFIDGNKRAALVAAYTFLAINDFELEAPEPEAVSVILGTADGSLSEEDLASWIRSHLIPWVD
ncbi:MAG: type II toxin-antitoxin system death-on-curing family toxin [Gemmatimonadota bacterium]|nr:MAG: type II toxin-antitoxin system death-on-curing family toxin [Gemmatimonadota bacterium]